MEIFPSSNASMAEMLMVDHVNHKKLAKWQRSVKLLLLRKQLRYFLESKTCYGIFMHVKMGRVFYLMIPRWPNGPLLVFAPEHAMQLKEWGANISSSFKKRLVEVIWKDFVALLPPMQFFQREVGFKIYLSYSCNLVTKSSYHHVMETWWNTNALIIWTSDEHSMKKHCAKASYFRAFWSITSVCDNSL